MPLVPGRYGIRIYSTLDGSLTDWIKDAASFDVEAGDYYGTGALPERGWGSFLLDYRFTWNEAEPQLPQTLLKSAEDSTS
jgi:lipopolysaccharide transport system ATP-binding protein